MSLHARNYSRQSSVTEITTGLITRTVVTTMLAAVLLLVETESALVLCHS